VQDVASQCGLLFAGRAGVARLGPRFAGERGGVDAHAERLDQAAVGGHVVARCQQHHVARHQLRHGQLHRTSVAQRGSVVRQQVAQRDQRFFRAVFLPEREQAVDDDDTEHRIAQHRHTLPRIAPFGEERQPGREPQDQREEMGKFLEQIADQRFLGNLLDLVGTEPCQALPCFGLRQPLRAAVQVRVEFFNGMAVRIHDEQSAIHPDCNRYRVVFKQFVMAALLTLGQVESQPAQLFAYIAFVCGLPA